MLPSLPRPRLARLATLGYVVAFLIYLFAPLVVVGVFAFNDGPAATPPWRGFTWAWFVADRPGQPGLLYDKVLLGALVVSLQVALWVTILSVGLGTAAALLFERHRFPFKTALYTVMLWPLVIPGVILGIAILLFSSAVAEGLETALDRHMDPLRPGLPLVVVGHVSFIATIAALVIAARLRKFDVSLEEAALNLGANRLTAFVTVTVPFLAPALIGAAVVAFLMSFENFNTTLMLVGSDAPLTIAMYSRLREGSTPVINAISLVLIFASALLAAAAMLANRQK